MMPAPDGASFAEVASLIDGDIETADDGAMTVRLASGLNAPKRARSLIREVLERYGKVNILEPKVASLTKRKAAAAASKTKAAETVAEARQQAISDTARALVESGSYVAVDDALFRFDTAAAAWSPCSAADLLAAARDGLERDMAKLVKAPADGLLRVSRHMVGEARAEVEQKVLPPAVREQRIRERDLGRPFNLDTGEVARGVQFEDAAVRVTRSGKIKATPADRRIFRRWALPAAWPGEVAETPPEWGEFCARSFGGDADRERLLAELVGATLAGDLSGRCQKVALLLGPGGSGKSTMLRLLESLLGGAALVKRSPALLAGRFALSGAPAAGALIVSDCPALPSLKSAQRGDFEAGLGTLKALSGGDPVDVERKHGPARSVTLDLGCWIGSNFPPQWPRSAEDLSAWLRRFAPVQFEKVALPARVENVEQRILERDGRGCLAGYFIGRYAAAVQRSRADGLGMVRFTEPASSRAILANIEAGTVGSVGEFVRQRLRFAPGNAIPLAELLSAAGKFAGLPVKPRSKESRNLAVLVQSIDPRITKRHGRGGTVFEHVGYADEPAQAELEP